jgi:hypothetical protein
MLDACAARFDVAKNLKKFSDELNMASVHLTRIVADLHVVGSSTAPCCAMNTGHNSGRTKVCADLAMAVQD